MRTLLSILALTAFLSSKAQTYLPGGNMGLVQWQTFPNYHLLSDSGNFNKKWHFNTYNGISAGFGFFNGRSGTFLSAPVGLQLDRRLNNNLFAFAGISAAPAFFNFNQSFAGPGLNKSYQGSDFSNAYGFGLNSRVELGLMYINDAKTFSISGSIGVDKSSYPVYSPGRQGKKQ